MNANECVTRINALAISLLTEMASREQSQAIRSELLRAARRRRDEERLRRLAHELAKVVEDLVRADMPSAPPHGA